MNYVFCLSIKEFNRYKTLFENQTSCFIIPKYLEKDLENENKIVLKNETIDQNIIDELKNKASKIIVFSMTEKSKAPLENNPTEVMNFVKNKFTLLLKYVQPLIGVSRDKKIPLLFFTQEVASFANSFDFFNFLLIDMLKHFVLGLWNELKIFDVYPQLFIISQSFVDKTKLEKKIIQNKKPIIKLGLKTTYLKKKKIASKKLLNKVSYA